MVVSYFPMTVGMWTGGLPNLISGSLTGPRLNKEQNPVSLLGCATMRQQCFPSRLWEAHVPSSVGVPCGHHPTEQGDLGQESCCTVLLLFACNSSSSFPQHVWNHSTLLGQGWYPDTFCPPFNGERLYRLSKILHLLLLMSPEWQQMGTLHLQHHCTKLYKSPVTLCAMERLIMFTRNTFVFATTLNAIDKLVFHPKINWEVLVQSLRPWSLLQECSQKSPFPQGSKTHFSPLVMSICCLF